MVTVKLVVNQTGKPDGEPGVSRDDLSAGTPVVVSNENNTGVTSWKWTLVARPSGSGAALETSTDSTTTFTPDLAGSYLIELKVNGRAKGRIIGAVKTSRGWRIPAQGEADEFDGWWAAMEFMLKDTNDNIGGGGGGGQTNTVAGENGIINVGTNVNAVVVPVYGEDEGTICQGSDSRLSDSRSPIGEAGGDLSGAYPTPTVSGLQGRSVLDAAPTGGQVLTWDAGGSRWAPADAGGGGAPSGPAGGDLSDTYPNPQVSGLRGATIDGSVSPLTNWVIAWDADGYKWVPQAQSGGTGTVDRYLVFSDDTQFSETSSGYADKKTFRIVNDSDKAVSTWRLVVEAWRTGGTSADVRLSIGGETPGTASVNVTATEGTIYAIELSAGAGDQSTDWAMDVKIQLRANGGGTAYIGYTDLYALFA